MRKKSGFIILVLVLSILCGCTKLNVADTTQQPQSVVNSTPVVTPQLIEELSEAEKYLLDKEPISYIPDGDAHANFFTLKFASSENGFYYLSSGNTFGTVYFYDIANKKSMPLCSRTDCNHRVKECTAYRAADEYYQEAILYDSGRIYMIATTDEGGYLDSWEEDGSGYKRVVKLWDKCTYMSNYNKYFNRIAMIHKGYFYYAWSDDYYTYNIARIKTDGSTKAEQMTSLKATEPGEGAWGTFLYASGDNVYVMLNQHPASSSIHMIDTLTGENDILYDRVGYNRGIYVEDDKIYTIDYDKLCRIDALTGEEKILYELPYGGTFFMSSDGKHIYIDNYYIYLSTEGEAVSEDISIDLKRTIYVLDMDGILVDEIILGESDGHVFFGDERYMFAMLHDPDYGRKLAYLDKRLIGSGLHEWKAVGY